MLVQLAGAVIGRMLHAGEALEVDNGCLHRRVDFDRRAGGITRRRDREKAV